MYWVSSVIPPRREQSGELKGVSTFLRNLGHLKLFYYKPFSNVLSLANSFNLTLSVVYAEVMKASQQAIERGVKDFLFVDYKRRSGHFDVTTVASIKEIADKVRSLCHSS